MKQVFMSIMLACAMGAATAAAPAPAAPTETLEVAVEGLNCALCSEAMKAKMLTAAGARDIEPRLECGRIYLEVDRGKRPNEAALTFLLTSNGFNLKGVKNADKTITQVRKTSPDAC